MREITPEREREVMIHLYKCTYSGWLEHAEQGGVW